MTAPAMTRRQRDADRLFRAIGWTVAAVVFTGCDAAVAVRTAPRRAIYRFGAWMSPDLVVCRWANCTHVEDES